MRGSRDHRNITEPSGTEDTAVAFNFRRGSESLGIIVRQFDGGLSFDSRYFTNQAHWIEVATARGIASAEIVGEQGSPTGAKANPATGGPLLWIVEISGAAKIVFCSGGSAARSERSAKICMQAQNVVDIERIGRNDALLLGITTTRLEPLDVSISPDVRVFAVDALASPR